MESAVRIVGDVADPKLAVGQRRCPIGTGFFVTVKSESLEGVRYGYVLTAHHVLWDQTRTEIQAPNPQSGGLLHPPVVIDDWRQPLPDVDLAVAPFHEGNNPERLYSSLELERHVLQPADVPALGAKVYYIGILTPLDRPMVRSGTVGAVSQHGIKHDGGYDYPVHLVDCRSYGGFSGSPCLVELPYAGLWQVQPYTEDPDGWGGPLGPLAYLVKLCGMFTQHLSDSDAAVSRYGVGTMLRSTEIWRALMSEEMRDERRGWDAENEAAIKREEPKLRGAATTPREGDYERFEDLARQLVNTPKPKPEAENES